MISTKLKNIYILLIPLFIVHGIEEYITGFYKVDPIVKLLTQYFTSIQQGSFVTLQILWWAILIATALLISKKGAMFIATFVGLILIFELHHLLHVIISLRYYPGTLTALVFPIVGFFYWKELIKIWKGNYDRD